MPSTCDGNRAGRFGPGRVLLRHVKARAAELAHLRQVGAPATNDTTHRVVGYLRKVIQTGTVTKVSTGERQSVRITPYAYRTNLNLDRGSFTASSTHVTADLHAGCVQHGRQK